MFSDKFVDITSAWQFFWNICLMIWQWLDSIKISLGFVNFSVFELFISLIAISLVWSFTWRIISNEWISFDD